MRRVTTFCVLVSSILLLIHGARSEHAFCQNAREIPNVIETDAAKYKQKDCSINNMPNDGQNEIVEANIDNNVNNGHKVNRQESMMQPPHFKNKMYRVRRQQRRLIQSVTKNYAETPATRNNVRRNTRGRRNIQEHVNTRRISAVKLTRETRRVSKRVDATNEPHRSRSPIKTQRRYTRQQRNVAIYRRRINTSLRKAKDTRRTSRYTTLLRVRRLTRVDQHTRNTRRSRRLLQRGNKPVASRTVSMRHRNMRQHRRVLNMIPSREILLEHDNDKPENSIDKEKILHDEDLEEESEHQNNAIVKTETKKSVHKNARINRQMRRSRERNQYARNSSTRSRSMIFTKQSRRRITYRNIRRETVHITRRTRQQRRRNRKLRTRYSGMENRRSASPFTSSSLGSNQRQRSMRENQLARRNRRLILNVRSRRNREQRELSSRRNTRRVRRVNNSRNIDYGLRHQDTHVNIYESWPRSVSSTHRSGRRLRRRNLHLSPSRSLINDESSNLKNCDIKLRFVNDNLNSNVSDSMETSRRLHFQINAVTNSNIKEMTSSNSMVSTSTKSMYRKVILPAVQLSKNVIDISEPVNIIRGFMLGVFALLGTRMSSTSLCSQQNHKSFKLGLTSF